MLKARNELLKKYDVTLTAHYRKAVSVYAESPVQAKEKTKIMLFDTDLINFTDDDFVCGEADITEQREDGLDEMCIRDRHYQSYSCKHLFG